MVDRGAAATGRMAPEDGVAFYRAAGWDHQAIERYKEKFGSFGQMIFPLPASYRRISDGDILRLGAHDWTVVVGSGHCPEHACLYCPQLKLLISGDQVLPRISSNVSVYPTEPEADPLSDWLSSLRMLKHRIPARVDELIESHGRGLSRLEEMLAEPKRASDVFGALFARPITSELLGMATGEAIAHLHHLARTGRAIQERDPLGIWWWRRSDR